MRNSFQYILCVSVLFCFSLVACTSTSSMVPADTLAANTDSDPHLLPSNPTSVSDNEEALPEKQGFQPTQDESLWETINASRINEFVLSKDSKNVAVGTNDGLFVFSLNTNDLILRDAVGGQVNALSFSEDSKYIAGNVTTPDSQTIIWTINVWSLETTSLLWKIEYTTGAASTVFSPDVNYLITGGNNGKLSVWSILSGELIQEIVDSGPIDHMAFSPDGSRFIKTQRSNGILLDPTTWKPIYNAYLVPYSPITQPVFSQDGRLAFLSGGGVKPYMLVVEQEDGTFKRRHTFRLGDGVRDLVFSPDGRYLYTLALHGELTQWGLDGDQGGVQLIATGKTTEEIGFDEQGNPFTLMWSGNGLVKEYP